VSGNRELVERFIACLDARDWGAWAELLHSAVVHETLQSGSISGGVIATCGSTRSISVTGICGRRSCLLMSIAIGIGS
jgi:hypothetical protein